MLRILNQGSFKKFQYKNDKNGLQNNMKSLDVGEKREKNNSFKAIISSDVFKKKLRSEEVIFLVVGAANTTVGYLIFYLLYMLMSGYVKIFIISLVSSVFATLFSTLTLERFVFKSGQRFISIFLKSSTTYIGLFLFAAILNEIFIGYIEISFWIAQIIIFFISIPVLFILHKKFTFKSTP